MVEIRARGDDPVDEAGFDKGHERGVAKPRRGERAADGEADRDVRLQHLVSKDVAGLAKPRAL